jgi:lipoprotein-anchoring transpeptidase ErfK/SrfK
MRASQPRRSIRATTGQAHRLRVALTTLALLAAAWTGEATAHAAPEAAVKSVQQLVTLLAAHEVLSSPAPTATSLGLLQADRPLTGERTVLPVLGRKRGHGGLEWLNVRLPGRPNGHTGWIRNTATINSFTNWAIVVDTVTRRVTVYRAGRPVRAFPAIVGKPSTPTPHGSFFVEEAIQLRPGEVGAPFALALSARSDVLQEFDGGPGQIALHGLENVGGVLGTAVSHGCVRLADQTMRWLVMRIGPGVPVTITG